MKSVDDPFVKVKIQSAMHPGEFYYEERFNNEVRKDFKDILRHKTSEKKINSFLRLLEGVCKCKKLLMEKDKE